MRWPLAFAEGVNAWPYRIEYWRNGQRLTDKITAVTELAKTSHAPFTERLDFSARTGSLKWNFAEVLGKATRFFRTGTQLSKEVAQIMFLFREADDEVHSEITTLALCVLFENLMHAVFNGLGLKEQELAKNPRLQAFQVAKDQICEQLLETIATKDGSESAGYNRVLRLLKSAAPLNQREILEAICNHLGIEWERNMQLAFNTWSKVRNLLVPEAERANLSEQAIKESMVNESRIAGMINILVLKLMGYSGWVVESPFEGKYRQI